ncbi:sigma-70 family RNA polymerase sigma factor [Spirosoma sp. KCTC 42546]|uniref:RNA polymerase sigma factor n=1 Tax=Spirosoma sp. KCTC 42546 TaxID=2520506 RepID=UPI001156CA1E|nr:sigma-70 family RNA polymerase sigma factor [Spirosoma sp. KCTC 42546]QDK77700.1 sigma-70 family RNA polymerase sigma factor [Spirosoma sp. KCTC 42546]
MDEQQLWKSFQTGDEDAYTQLYQLHIRAMYRYGMSLVSASEAFVLDSIHDVFTEIWVKRSRLTTPDNVRSYLLKSLKTRIIHQLERKERPFQSLTETDFDTLWDEPNDLEILEELEAATSRQQRLQRLIAQLPPRQQEALKLRFVENMDYNQIGEVLSVNQQSAKNLVFRAVEKLRGWIVLPFLTFFHFF